MRALLAVAVCLSLALGGCGGGDDSSATSSTGETTSASAPQGSRQGEDKSAETQNAKGGDRSASKSDSNGSSSKHSDKDSTDSSHPQRTKVPPISSAPIAGSRKPAPGVKTVPGADNSVQEYGVESGEAQRREASIALQAYLNARAEEDWSAACSYLAQRPMQQLERVQQAGATQGPKLDGCPQVMALLREGEAQAEAGAKITEVLSLRGGGDVSGDPSYLIYLAPPGRTLYSMPMYLQGGAWKVGLAKAAELPVN